MSAVLARATTAATATSVATTAGRPAHHPPAPALALPRTLPVARVMAAVSSVQRARAAAVRVHSRRGASSAASSSSRGTTATATYPVPETDKERSPIDFPQEWVTPQPTRRPDTQPEFEKLETPMPKPLPGDPEAPDDEAAEEEERKKKKKEDPDSPDGEPEPGKEEPDKPPLEAPPPGVG